MFEKDIIKKIKEIEIKSNQLVQEIFSGEYHSVFKGNGLELEDIREYQSGDDIRSIDWNVTARHNRPYVKQFKEERELNLFLLIDVSASTFFGKKRQRIAELAATLAFSGVKNNDKVGALLFSDTVEKVIPSKKGKKHALSILGSLLNTSPVSKKTSIENALLFFNKFEKKNSIVFILSDFLDDDFVKELMITDKKHDLILIQVQEESEQTLPKGAIFVLEDMETGETVTIDNRKSERESDFEFKYRNLIKINTTEDFVKPLMYFFKRRMRR